MNLNTMIDQLISKEEYCFIQLIFADEPFKKLTPNAINFTL